MARWKLDEAHYLFGHPNDLEETEWEYKETNRVTGREMRKRFKVPYFFEADTIVCYEGKGQPEDGVFEGNPTPAMVPLDDEARAISASFAGQWVHPIESLPGQGGFSQSILANLERQVDELARKTPTSVVQSGVSKEEFEALKNQLAELMAQKAEAKAPESKRKLA